MSKNFFRIVAVMLVSCLLADPSLAAAKAGEAFGSISSTSVNSSRFCDQALMLPGAARPMGKSLFSIKAAVVLGSLIVGRLFLPSAPDRTLSLFGAAVP